MILYVPVLDSLSIVALFVGVAPLLVIRPVVLVIVAW